MEKRILILGVGNTLLGDEGFGVHAVRYLERHFDWPANVRLVDGGTLGLLLLAELMECDLAIILDVALGGHAPGTFYQLDAADLNPALSIRQSMHQTSLGDTLISCELAGHKPEALIYAMEPFDIQNARACLTRQAEKKLPQFCARVVAELGKAGITAKKKPCLSRAE
ncbi:MAG: hydrogenase maturation protease [Desulfovibrio sp.]|nr:hydrogenase maturation protease [Desulfovibrio sp.]